MAALLKKKVLPKEHAEKTLAALMAHHHHAQTKERHSMLEARAHRRMEQSIKNFRKANLQTCTSIDKNLCLFICKILSFIHIEQTLLSTTGYAYRGRPERNLPLRDPTPGRFE